MLDRIKRLLIERGRSLFEKKKAFVEFTKDRVADQLLNDLHTTPHAFVIACIMDRQMKTELVWLIPYKISQKIGGFGFQNLVRLSFKDIYELMTVPEPLHRYPNEMSKNFHEAVTLIDNQYKGNAANLWIGKPSSADVIYRFLQFRGVGPKIATMATNILARDFKVPFSDYYSIDISVDVHVRRVLSRLGLISPTASNEEIQYRARALSPEFPGLIDLPLWEIGRSWCKPKNPLCAECHLNMCCTFNCCDEA